MIISLVVHELGTKRIHIVRYTRTTSVHKIYEVQSFTVKPCYMK